MEVQDLLFDLLDEEPYEKLKEQLVARIADSECQKLRQLLTAEELGDRKPTQLLRKMHLLLGEKANIIDSSLLRELFSQRLPSNVQMILASADMMAIDKLAEMADRIMDVATPTISSVSTSSEGGEFRRMIREEVAAALRTQERSRPRNASWNGAGRNRSRRHSSSRGQSPGKQQANQEGVCWYHQRLDQNARKCRPPFSAGNAGASR